MSILSKNWCWKLRNKMLSKLAFPYFYHNWVNSLEPRTSKSTSWRLNEYHWIVTITKVAWMYVGVSTYLYNDHSLYDLLAILETYQLSDDHHWFPVVGTFLFLQNFLIQIQTLMILYLWRLTNYWMFPSDKFLFRFKTYKDF